MIPVIVKVQRPLMTNGNWNEVMSYIVDEQGEQASNPAVAKMKLKHIKKLFGNCHKVYYLGEYEEGQPVRLVQPIRLEDWE